MRVVFLGTPDFAVPSLSALLDDDRFNVVVVVTQPDRPAGRGRKVTASPVKHRAVEAGVEVFQPRRLSNPDALARLAAAKPDVFVIAAYGQLLRPAVLALPAHGCLNVHPSLLPRHRGAAPIAAAILAGDEATGVTIMLTDAGMDTGPILTQREIPLADTETTASLTPRLAAMGAELLRDTLPLWVAGRLAPQPQDEAVATTSRLFTREDGAVDWRGGAPALARQIRALNPWPRAYTLHAGHRILLLHAIPGPPLASGEAAPGTVLGTAGGALRLATGSGDLLVLEAQVAGRRPVAGATLVQQGLLREGDVLSGC